MAEDPPSAIAQLRAVSSLRDAEHLRDHDEGEREREVGDEIHLAGATGLDRGEAFVDELFDAGMQLLDHARREHRESTRPA